MLEVGVGAPTGVEPGVAAFGVVSGWFQDGGDVSPEPVGVTLISTVVRSAAAYVGVGPEAVRGFTITVLGVVCESGLLGVVWVSAAPVRAVWNVYKLTFHGMFNANMYEAVNS